MTISVSVSCPDCLSLPLDCLQLAERFISENRLVDAEMLRAWRDQAAQEVEQAVSIAQKEPVPEGAEEDWCAISTRALCDQAE